MNKAPIAIVGCGGMGGRHLLGIRELYEAGLGNVDLVAVCDLRRDNAEYLANNVEQLLGRRPQVFQDMATMVKALPELQGVSITTDSGSHHQVATMALELGLHVMVEKPLALTIRGCNMILAAQQRNGKILSVAEQERRDPMCRLTKAVVDSGVLGEIYMLFQMDAGSSNKIIIWPWRHYKNIGGIIVDAGVHTADQMQYYLGYAREVYAHTRRFEPVRYRGERIGVNNFYEHWYTEVPDQIEATAEDMLASLITFDSGATGQWTSFRAAHGKGFNQSVIYGSKGSLHIPGSRNGRPVLLHLDNGGEVSGDAVLELVPDFHLDATTATLFKAERLGSYTFSHPEADRMLLAIEYREFGECLETGAQPEVDGYMGRKALALCNAALESGVLNRPVTLEEIETEQTAVYEADINAYWKI
jgi:predicted dehydrogenase